MVAIPSARLPKAKAAAPREAPRLATTPVSLRPACSASARGVWFGTAGTSRLIRPRSGPGGRPRFHPNLVSPDMPRSCAFQQAHPRPVVRSHQGVRRPQPGRGLRPAQVRHRGDLRAHASTLLGSPLSRGLPRAGRGPGRGDRARSGNRREALSRQVDGAPWEPGVLLVLLTRLEPLPPPTSSGPATAGAGAPRRRPSGNSSRWAAAVRCGARSLPTAR